MKNIILALIILLFPITVSATTDTFQEGVSSYAGTSDANIMSYSTNEHITNIIKIQSAGNGRLYILHFDISSIDSSATVSSATVTLYVSEQNCTDETIGVRQIEDPDSTGAFDDNESAADVFNDYATWDYKDETGTIDWDSGASVGFSDVDDNANESTTTSGSCPGYVSKSWTVTTMVGNWVADSTLNAGMMFSLATSGNVQARSKRYGTSSERPLLSVTYTVSSPRRVILPSD